MSIAAEAPRGFWLALEGGEGAGKSGVADHIASALRSQGRKVLSTREPGGTPEGQTLRSMLLSAGAPQWEPMAELLLMAAARVQHVRRVIEPNLREGAIVICDRYVGSSIAYQGAGRGISDTFIRYLHEETTSGAWPDLTLVLDVDPSIGLARSRNRLTDEVVDEGRFEDLELQFHERVRKSFLEQAAVDPQRVVVVDANRPQLDVLADALRVVIDRLQSDCARFGS